MATKVQEFETAVNAAFDKIDAGLETAQTASSGISDDVAFLKSEIEKLQASQGQVTTEDQAALDRIQARINGLSTKTESLASGLAQIDQGTERPTPPVEPPTPA